MFSLKILGPPSLFDDSAAVALGSRKSMALLMLLACSAEPVPRGRLAALLWPALDETLGRRNLRRELARLRDVGVSGCVSVVVDMLTLSDAVTSDLEAFDAALQAGRPDEALALWRGPLAEGFVLEDTGSFDDWLDSQRARLGERRRLALCACVITREAAGDLAGALTAVEALLADDPLQEQHHRDAMRLFAALGRREAALAQYGRCRTLLRNELGLAPMAETEALAATLRGATGSAAAVASVAAVAAHDTAPAPASPAPAPPARDARRACLPLQLPFVGRAAEVARLEVAWAAASPIVIEGEAGVGKTRLATDFAAAHGPFALARCRPGDAELPYSSFTRALRALMGPALALPDLPDWIGRELSRLMTELGPAPAPIRSDEERNRFFEACARSWHALAAENFDAVVLDDWHLADAASRALLGFIAQRRTESAPSEVRELLVLRPGLDAGATASLRSLIEATGAPHLKLQALPSGAVLDLVRQLSGASHPVRFAERLERATGGNPFFLAETLRHLVEAELLSSDADGGWHTPFDEATRDYHELPVPASVLETVLARVHRLSAASQRVLEAAALAAEPFAPSLLAPACALSELDAVLAIEEAVAASLLNEHAAGGFAFAHDLVQQALNGALSEQRRRLVHRRLALGAEAAGAPAATIAGHHEASGDPSRAVPYRLLAGDRAQNLHALAEAIGHWRKALAASPAPAQAIELHRRISWAAEQRSENDAVQAQADALGALLESAALTPHERIEASVARARAMSAAGCAAGALTLLDGLPPIDDPRQQAAFLFARGSALQTVGRSEEGLSVAQAALALPSLSVIDRIELLDIAFISDHNAGRVESALARADAMLELSLRVGYAHGIARSRYRRGIELVLLDDMAGAETALLAAADECERFGFVYLERVVIYNLKCVFSGQSQHARALAAIERGWGLQPPIQAGPLRAMYRLAMLDAQVALGDFGAAWESARFGVEDTLAQSDPPVRMAAVVCALEPLALLGETALARRLLAAVDDAALRELVNAASEMWVALAQFELSQGDPAAAARALGRLDEAGGLVEERVRVRCQQARAELLLAQGDALASLALLPADDAAGMNAELVTRGLALRLRAEARLGRIGPATAQAAAANLAAPAVHACARLALHAALAGAAPLAGSTTRHAAFLAGLCETLRDHPAQQAALRRAWAA